MNAFQAREVLCGVYHIEEPMGVCMTLLTGSSSALLIDTGYGLSDVRAFVRKLTDLPLQVLLTHAHHDHAAGAVWFDRVFLLEDDLPSYPFYTDEAHRLRVMKQAAEKGVAVPDGYPSMPVAEALALEAGDINLGGLTARIIACPGHTPGSCVIEVPERQLLITGDNWNPCTWAFFPEAPDARTLRRNMREVLAIPFAHVLCSHQPQLYPRQKIDFFFDHLTDEALLSAPKVDMGRAADTHQLTLADGQRFVFDYAKFTAAQED